MRYAIIIEKAGANYSAYVPDLPGCIATAATIGEVQSEIGDAIRFHLEGQRKMASPLHFRQALLSMWRHNFTQLQQEPWHNFFVQRLCGMVFLLAYNVLAWWLDMLTTSVDPSDRPKRMGFLHIR